MRCMQAHELNSDEATGQTNVGFLGVAHMHGNDGAALILMQAYASCQ